MRFGICESYFGITQIPFRLEIMNLVSHRYLFSITQIPILNFGLGCQVFVNMMEKLCKGEMI